MSEQLQLRRGTESQIAAFVGAQGEATPATDTMRLHVHDGATAGGWPHALEARSAVSDANYSVKITDRQVAYTAITAARIVSLPAASSYPVGATLTVIDESGACSPVKTIALSRAGADTINGAASAVIACAYGYLALESNGANAWTIVDQSTFASLVANAAGGVLSASGAYAILAGSLSAPILIGQAYGNGSQPPKNTFLGEASRSGAPGTFSAVQAGDTLAGYTGAGDNGSAFTAPAASIHFVTTQAWTSTANGAAITFGVTANNATAAGGGAEAMRIDNTGYVGIGTTSPGAPLDVAGNIQTHGSHGSAVQLGVIEDVIACSGATSTSTQQIPNRAIVIAVSVYVVAAITGASSYNVDATTNSTGGAGGSSGQFGSNLGIAAGSNNVGVIGPTAWYAPSTIKLTANGGNFTGGQVRVSIQYLLCGAPTS